MAQHGTDSISRFSAAMQDHDTGLGGGHGRLHRRRLPYNKSLVALGLGYLLYRGLSRHKTIPGGASFRG